MRDRKAFTLIELLVVIVIIAILMAIAIPTFLNQRDKAWDSSAKQSATLLYKDMRSAIVTDTSQYTYNNATLNNDASIANFVASTEPELSSHLVSGSVFASGGGSTSPAQSLAEGDCAIATVADAAQGGNYDIAEIVCRSKTGKFWVLYDAPNDSGAFPLHYEYAANAPTFDNADSNYIAPTNVGNNW
jgi:prepilin-type N-terminal cleavage/methylation domain-containing protein